MESDKMWPQNDPRINTGGTEVLDEDCTLVHVDYGSVDEAEVVAEALGALESLWWLRLNPTNGEGEEGLDWRILPILSALPGSCVTHLSLEGINGLTEAELEALADAVSSSVLSALSLADTTVSEDASWATLFERLQGSGLRELDIKGVCLGSEAEHTSLMKLVGQIHSFEAGRGAVRNGLSLLEGWVERGTALQRLLLTDIAFNNADDGEVGNLFEQVLSRSKNMIVLKLWKCSLHRESLMGIGVGLTAAGPLVHLEELFLDDLDITDEELAEMLGVWLPNMPYLRKLGLSHCRMGRNSSRALGLLFEGLPLLEWLNLNGNYDIDVPALSLGLPTLPELYHLMLGWGQACGDEGAVALAQALPQCPSLRFLLLIQCGIGDEGALAIAEFLGKTSLEQCLLAQNVANRAVVMPAFNQAVIECETLFAFCPPTELGTPLELSRHAQATLHNRRQANSEARLQRDGDLHRERAIRQYAVAAQEYKDAMGADEILD